MLVQSFAGSAELKIYDILKLLKAQVDPTTRGFNQTTSGDKRFVVQLKFNSFRCWNLTGRVIALSVTDPTDVDSANGGRDQLCGLVDTGSQYHTPAVGYLLSASHRNQVLRTDDVTGNIPLLAVTAATGDQCILYIDCAYKFDGPVVPPKITTEISKVVNHQIAESNITSESQRILSEINSAVYELRRLSEASKPSFVEKVIDGAKEAALLVADISALRIGSSSSSFTHLDQGDEAAIERGEITD